MCVQTGQDAKHAAGCAWLVVCGLFLSVNAYAVTAANFLWVNASLNSSPKGFILAFIEPDNAQRVWVASESLDGLLSNASYSQVTRIIDGDAFTDLNSVSGLDYSFDNKTAKLDLYVDPAQLPLNQLVVAPYHRRAIQRGHGLHLNYDVLATSLRFRDLDLVNGLFQAVYFNPLGTLRHSFRGLAGEQVSARVSRLDTTWIRDFIGLKARLELGDFLSSPDLFGSRYRLAGVRFAREFGITPTEPSFERPAFFGVSEVPSNVELFVDGVRRARTQTQAGPFQLDYAPVLTGAGVANIVLTNALGEQILESVNYYIDPQLLRAGLWDYDMSVGWQREAYGIDDFNYSRLNALGALRYGVNKSITVEWNGRLSQPVSSSEMRFRFKLMSLPVTATTGVGLHAAEKQSPNFVGRFGGNYRGKAFFANLEAVLVDVRSDQAQDLPFTRQVLGGAGYSLRKWRVSYNLLHRRRSANDVFTRHGLRLSRSARLSFGNVYFSTGVSRTLDRQNRNDTTLLVSVSWTPSSEHFFSVRDEQLSKHRFESSYRYRPKDELSTSAYVTQQYRDQNSRINGGLEKNFSQMQLRARMENIQSSSSGSIQLGARGAVGMMQGKLFAARALGSSYALVDLSGQENLPVYVNHRMVARTDQRGLAVVPNLLAYQENRVTANPLDFNLEAYPIDESLISVPAANTGIYLKFDVREARGFELTLMRTPAQVVPAGAAIVSEQSQRRFYVGDRGRGYLEQDAEEVSYQVYWAQHSCRFTIKLKTLPEGLQPDVGKVLCR